MNLLVDSSVFIAAAHHRPYRQLLDVAIRRGRLLLNSIVAMELYAGFRSQGARRAFTGLQRDLHRAGKVVVHFRDGLIAVSAARVGATVVTENRRNFELWREGLARSGRRLALSVVSKK